MPKLRSGAKSSGSRGGNSSKRCQGPAKKSKATRHTPSGLTDDSDDESRQSLPENYPSPEEFQALRAKNKQLEDRLAKTGMTKEQEAKYNGELQKHIETVVTDTVWRTVKFLSNKRQTAIFCKKVFDNLDMTQSDLHNNSFKLWQETYGSYCVTALNKTRTYVVQRIRHVVFDYVRDKLFVEAMPTFEAIELCVDRSMTRS